MNGLNMKLENGKTVNETSTEEKIKNRKRLPRTILLLKVTLLLQLVWLCICILTNYTTKKVMW